MFVLRRLWKAINNRSRYVGRDLEGNRFYEHPSSSEDPRRTKRTVRYTHPDDVWHYIGSRKRLPVQWTAWLTHTRPKPPTLEELQADIARQRRVLANVALIEARDRNERRGLAAIPSGSIPHQTSQDQRYTGDIVSNAPRATLTSPEQSESAESREPLPRAKMATEVFEPQSWTPRARIRRGIQ